MERLFWAGLAFLLGATFSLQSSAFDLYDLTSIARWDSVPRALFQLAIFASLVWGIGWLYRQGRRGDGSRPLLIFLGAYGILCLIGALIPHGVQSGITATTCMLALVVGIGMPILCQAGRVPVAPVCVVLVSIQAILSLAFFATKSQGMYSADVFRSGGTFADPNNLYFLLVFGAILSLFLARTSKRRPQQWLYGLCLGVICFGLLVTWQRIGIFAVCSVALLWAVLRRRADLQLWTTLAAVTVALVSVYYARLGDESKSSSASRSDLGRIQNYKEAYGKIAETFPSGFGVGGFRYSIDAATPDGYRRTEVTEPKSVPLLAVGEAGILGVTLLVLFAGALTQALRKLSNTGDLYLGLWTGMLVCTLVDTPIGAVGRYSGTALFGCLVSMTVLELSRLGALAESPAERRALNARCNEWVISK